VSHYNVLKAQGIFSAGPRAVTNRLSYLQPFLLIEVSDEVLLEGDSGFGRVFSFTRYTLKSYLKSMVLMPDPTSFRDSWFRRKKVFTVLPPGFITRWIWERKLDTS